MFDYIQGNKFKSLADNKKIFFAQTHHKYFVYNSIDAKNIIYISHNSDVKITDKPRILCDADSKCKDKFYRWFGQNVDVIDDKIESIPIGLENSNTFSRLKKIEVISDKLNDERKIKNLLYINHDISSNVKEREEPYKIFADSSYVTMFFGKNGMLYNEYVDNIYNHMFVICPEGYGIDTHRTWECLYLGSIPIVKRNINTTFYTDLPICFVNDWNEINEKFLLDEYKRIKSSVWNMDKLNFSYWKNKILECAQLI